VCSGNPNLSGLIPPFSLALPGTDCELHCRRAVRTLPGRRLVCAGSWQGRNVYAKLFFNTRKAKRDWQRELRGIGHLQAAGIPTPPLLYAGFLPDRQCYLLVLDAIEPAATARDAWTAATTHEQQDRLLTAMARLLADHHNAGITHHDPHLNNFLVSGETIHTLDGADVVQHGRPVRTRTALANLAACFATLHLGTGDASRRFFNAYRKHRQPEPGEDSYPLFIHLLVKTTRRNIRKYLHEKIFRDCTEFSRKRTFSRLVILNRLYDTPGIRALLAAPDTLLQDPQTGILKAGGKSTVAFTRIDGFDIIIKHYKIKGLMHGLRRAVTLTRAERSWVNSHRLLAAGILTATPMAILLNTTGPFKRESYFLARHVDGQLLYHYLADKAGSPDELKMMALQIADMLRTLAYNKISHGDMKAANILVVDGRPVLLDLDSMKQHRFAILFRARFRKDLDRLLQCWPESGDFRDALEAEINSIARDFL